MYVTIFDVDGDGRFPLDMLRYDSCFPRDDVVGLIGVDGGRRTVRMACYHKLKSKSYITPARWESFGWTVTKIECRKV